MIELCNPTLNATITVSASAARVHRKSGWRDHVGHTFGDCANVELPEQPPLEDLGDDAVDDDSYEL